MRHVLILYFKWAACRWVDAPLIWDILIKGPEASVMSSKALSCWLCITVDRRANRQTSIMIDGRSAYLLLVAGAAHSSGLPSSAADPNMPHTLSTHELLTSPRSSTLISGAFELV